MDITIAPLTKKDFNAARKFAIKGMHLSWYTSNRLELYLYSQYFLYLELSRATNALGAYMGGNLVGVLLADIHGWPKVFRSVWCRLFIGLATFVINAGYREASGAYDNTNKKLIGAYQTKRKTDGEFNFFAVDPAIKGKGIGTVLLNELEKQAQGKHIYLFTDSGSTYQFYTRRGFDEVGREDITLAIHGRDVPLACMLFSKTLYANVQL